MKISLDVGNSRIKWRSSEMLESCAAESIQALQSQWQGLKSSDVCELNGCNVRGRAVAVEIDLIAEQLFSREVCWLKSQAQAAGVSNAYRVPAQLGVDRWAAMIAARAHAPDEACIVVDAGSAVTVDAIDANGFHRGGVILPGLQMLFNGLGGAAQLQNLAAEKREHLMHQSRALTRSTDEAIVSGVVFSMRGGVYSVIEQQCRQINVKIRSIPIFVTGGDAHMLNFDSLKIQWLPDLVLEGVTMLSETEQ